MITQARDEHGPSGRGLLHEAVLVLAPMLVALVFGWWMLARRQYLLVDDAYISFRYAANLADGHGLVWNAGVPVEGYTCLLWVLLLSCIASFGVDLTFPAVALSALFGLGCLELLRRITRAQRTNGPSHWELVPGALLASIPSFGHAMTSGMEESSFAFFTLLAVHLLLLGRQRAQYRLWAGLAFGAACLTRPEGALIAAVALTTEATPLAGHRTRLRELLAPGLCVALVVLVHTTVRLAYYGYPFPNTFYAKVIFGLTTLERGATHIWGFFLAGGWLLLLGLPRAKQPSILRPWIAHGYALVLVYCIYLLMVGGDHPRWFRFYVPLLALPLLGVSEQLRAWVKAPRWLRDPSWSWRAVFVQGSLCAGLAFSALPFSEADEPIVGVIEPPIKKLMDDVDRFFDEVPKHSFCAVAAIGYVGYRHLDLHILDIWGLTDTHIAHLKVAPSVKFGHDKVDAEYVAAMKPDYVYMFTDNLGWAGYDLCWPSDNPPAKVYRRAFPLTTAETQLGVPKSRTRDIGPPPQCRPPEAAAGSESSR